MSPGKKPSSFGYPEGSVFNNTLVRRKRTPSKFIYEVAIPYSHPEAVDVNIISEKPLQELAELFQRYTDPNYDQALNKRGFKLSIPRQ